MVLVGTSSKNSKYISLWNEQSRNTAVALDAHVRHGLSLYGHLPNTVGSLAVPFTLRLVLFILFCFRFSVACYYTVLAMCCAHSYIPPQFASPASEVSRTFID